MELSDFFWFSDAQWARIGPLLPTDTRGMARVDDRRVLSGIVHALRNGGRWADCPREVYGPKKTLYNRFVNGGAKLVHPGGAKLVHLMLCGTRCWGVVPVVHRRDPRCFV